MSRRRTIYLDHAATTPVDPRVAERMAACLTEEGDFGNPASRSHGIGWAAERLVERARTQVADLVGAAPREIVWTSGATESDNLAVIGAARALRARGNHVISCTTEHRAVLDSCLQLEREGWDVEWLAPDSNGIIEAERVAAALRPETVLVSLMHVNNEIGVIHDIAAIGRHIREHGALFHVDAAQSAGKLPIDLRHLPVDLMSFSAHKIHGPKGVGALYVRDDPAVRILPLLHGGGQERGLRPGTLATHQIVGMGEAFRIADQELVSEAERQRLLRDRLWDGLRDLGAIRLNGHPLRRAPGILNVCIEGVGGEALIMAMRDVALSSGSACASGTDEPSYVLQALGLTRTQAESSIRLSLGRTTTATQVDDVVAQLRDTVPRLRALSPGWRAHGTVRTDGGPSAHRSRASGE